MSFRKIIGIALLCVTAPLCLRAQSTAQDKFQQALRLIEKNYVDSLSDMKLVDAAIRGLFTELDPHSKYISRTEAQAMQSVMDGSFVGIGIEYMMQNDTVYVTQILPDGPAEKAGIFPGDRIVKVDGSSVAGVGLTNADIFKKIRGEKNTSVKIEILRPLAGHIIALDIPRGAVTEHSITAAYMLDSRTGYIAIKVFSRTTRNEIEVALKDLKKKGMEQLVLDLQGNGGGYVEAAFGVADEFLKRDQLVYYAVTQDKGKDYYYAAASGISWNGKMAVLVDQNTASASEILAGALQDWDRAVIVGRRTYGKGLTQKRVALSDGSIMELTGARLFTPAGRSVQKPYKGVNYSADIHDRYLSGELFREMKIGRPDSLKFKTLINKRTIYGGGGIMPDKFVALDTLDNASWLRSVAAAGLVNETSWKIADTYRSAIRSKFPDISEFSASYKVPRSAIGQIEQAAKKKGFKIDGAHKQRILELLALEIKAQIANLIYVGKEQYWRVINQENGSIKEAVRILMQPEEYKNYLDLPSAQSGNSVHDQKN